MLNKKLNRDFAQIHSNTLRLKIFPYAILRFCFFVAVLLIGQATVLYGQNEGQDTSTASLVAMLDTKISTAAKYTQSASEAPASVTVITADEISSYGYQTLAEALESVRGLYVSYDRTYNYIGTRGFGRPSDYNNRILLLLNGHTLNENVFGSAPFGTDFVMDMSGVERIEIVRGPGSVLYGSGAVFAVVNVITKNGNSINGLEGTLETGSYGKYNGSLLYGREFNNGMNLAISATGMAIAGQDLYFSEYDDPATNNGIAHNLDQDNRIGLFANLQYHNFELHGFGSSREKGIPTGAWGVSFNTAPSKAIDKWNYIQLKYDSPISSNKNILARVYYDYYFYKAWYPSDITQREVSYGDWVGSELQFRWDFRPDNTFTLGTEYQNQLRAKYKNWDPDTVWMSFNFPTNIISFYCQDEYQATEYLSFIIGLRHERYVDNLNSTTPRGAIVYNPFKTSIFKFLYGEAFRRPTLLEANFDFVEYDNGSNSRLKPENNQTFEVVWEQRLTNQFSGIISWYKYRMTNLIDQTSTGSDSESSLNNLAKVSAQGVELQFDANFSNVLSGCVNYSYQTNNNSLTNQKLSNFPKHLFKTNITYNYKLLYHLGAGFNYESSRLTESRIKTKPFLLTNLNLRYTPIFDNHSGFGQLAQNMELSFQLKNLFNVHYTLPVGLEYRQTSLPQDGRNYLVMLKLKL